MKVSIAIKVTVDLAEVITALTSLVMAIAYAARYI